MSPESRRVAIDLYQWESLSIIDQIKRLPLYPKLLIGSGIGSKDLVPVDINGCVFKDDNHLWLDFDHVPTLKIFPDCSISAIIFDQSTFRYMHCDPQVIAEWKRMLIDNGSLCFEFGFASVSFGPQFSFNDNPCHIKSPLTRSIYVYKALSDISRGIQSDTDNLYAKIAKSHQEELFHKLKGLFSSWKSIEIKHRHYPYHKINVEQWVLINK